MVQLDELLGNFPPVTQVYILTTTALMVFCSLDIISPYSLYLNWSLVIEQWEVWRLFTAFLFFGDFGVHFFWNIYMLLFYCSSLEEDVFRGRSADFLWMLLTTGTMLLGMSYILGAGLFFSGAMINVMTYIWSRRNSSARMSVFIFTVRAPYMPWVMCGLSFLVGWGMTDHLMGIAAGHIYFFLEDVYPLMPTSKGTKLLRTPSTLKRLMGQPDDD